MRKKFVLLLIVFSISTSSIIILAWYTYKKTWPLTQPIESELVEETLLVCTNLRTLHVQNSLGDIEIKAKEGFILRDHTIRATSVTLKLSPPTAQPIIASANNAEISTAAHYFMLQGKVHAQQNTTDFFSENLLFKNQEKILIAEKNLLLCHPSGNFTADKAVIGLQHKTITLNGNVTSKFSTKPLHIPQQ